MRYHHKRNSSSKQLLHSNTTSSQQLSPRAKTSFPAGLENLGQTCYLNAILQALAHCPSLVSAVNDSAHGRFCVSPSTCVLCSVESHIKSSSSAVGTLSTIAPRAIVEALPLISQHTMTRGFQEDAHEFLRHLVNAMQSCESSEEYPSHLFRGAVNNQIRCTICSSVSIKTDPIEDLELDVSRASSLDTALNEFCRVEYLAGANAFHCEKCKKLTTAQRCMLLHELPPILSIQLKRFAFQQQGQGRIAGGDWGSSGGSGSAAGASSGGAGKTSKISHYVEYPELLDLSPFLTSHESLDDSEHPNSASSDPDSSFARETKMLLSAVVVHIGSSIASGHYIAYVKSRANVWYRVDDNHVRPASLEEALSQSAYILFYNRCEPSDLLQASPSTTSQHSSRQSSQHSSPRSSPRHIGGAGGSGLGGLGGLGLGLGLGRIPLFFGGTTSPGPPSVSSSSSSSAATSASSASSSASASPGQALLRSGLKRRLDATSLAETSGAAEKRRAQSSKERSSDTASVSGGSVFQWAADLMARGFFWPGR